MDRVFNSSVSVNFVCAFEAFIEVFPERIDGVLEGEVQKRVLIVPRGVARFGVNVTIELIYPQFLLAHHHRDIEMVLGLIRNHDHLPERLVSEVDELLGHAPFGILDPSGVD